MPVAPKVFISYSHDSEAHEGRVLDLANRLREDGIDAEIDQYETSPAEGWPTWCERQIKSAGFVLLMCTETYLRRVDGEEAPGVGHGVLWEARIMRQLLYDTTFRERSRQLLSGTFDLSLDALAGEGGEAGEGWRAALHALGFAPAAGFGESLGAAIAGLSAAEFGALRRGAGALSLLDRVPRGKAGTAFRLHPLLAELGRARARANKDAVIARMTEWFVVRLPEGGEDQGRRWDEIQAESAAPIEWLPQVKPDERGRVERAGSWFAMINGPFHSWLRFCEDALTGERSDEERSQILLMLGEVARRGGLPDRALAAAEQKRELDSKRGDEFGAAVASGQIADVLEARGDLDGALKIRREEQLPVYERLGDVRAKAVCNHWIAWHLAGKGDRKEGIRLIRDEVLPVYQKLNSTLNILRTQRNLATLLLQQEGPESVRGEARRLLCLALADARRLKVPEAQEIQGILERYGLSCD